MSEKCEQSCQDCQEECSERIEKEKPHRLSTIKKVIAVMSGKGGVGKSYVTSMLAVMAARQGYRSAILDADITGPSIAKAFGIVEKAKGDDQAIYPALSQLNIQIMSTNMLLSNDTDPVVWRGPLIANMVKQFWTDVAWKEVDFLFVDMPPGTGDVSLTVFQSLPVDGIVIVTSPQDLVTMIVAKAINMARMMHIPVIGLVENMSYFVCSQCDAKHEIFGKSQIQEVASLYELPVLGQLPLSSQAALYTDQGQIEMYEDEEVAALFVRMLELLP